MSFVLASTLETSSSLMIAISGPTGSGKTIAAMLICKGLGGKTAIVNTEKHGPLTYIGRGDLGLNEFDFIYQKLVPPFTPEAFIMMIDEADRAGAQNLIFDSFSHEWNGSGGVLELVDMLARAKFQGNSWAAWSEMTPRHRAVIDRMSESNLNILCTMRSKTETTQQQVNGKTKVIKLGMKAEQRDGIEYDFTVVIDMTEDHYAMMTNDRTGVLSTAIPQKITIETGYKLKAWLNRFKDAPNSKIKEPSFCIDEPIDSKMITEIQQITDQRVFLEYISKLQEFKENTAVNDVDRVNQFNNIWRIYKQEANRFDLEWDVHEKTFITYKT